MNKLARLELVFCLASEVGGVTIAELGDRFVVDAKDGDSAFEVRNQHEATVEVDVARHAHPFGDEAFVLAVKIEHLEAAVASIGDNELSLTRDALVNPKTVGAAHLSGSVSGADNGTNIGTVLGVFVDETAAVAVTDEDVPSGEKCDVGGVPAVSVSVLSRFLRVVQFPDDSTIKVGFGNYLSVDIADVEELFPSFFAEVEAVGAARPFGAE